MAEEVRKDVLSERRFRSPLSYVSPLLTASNRGRNQCKSIQNKVGCKTKDERYLVFITRQMGWKSNKLDVLTSLASIEGIMDLEAKQLAWGMFHSPIVGHQIFLPSTAGFLADSRLFASWSYFDLLRPLSSSRCIVLASAASWGESP